MDADHGIAPQMAAPRSGPHGPLPFCIGLFVAACVLTYNRLMQDRKDQVLKPVEPRCTTRSELSSRRCCLLPVVGLTALAVLAGLAGFLYGRGQVPFVAWSLSGAPRAQVQRFLPFWEAWLKVERLFYHEEPLDPTAMTYGAISGVLSSLQDPYAAFSNPPGHRIENDSFAGEFGGIGAWLARDERGTYVDSVLPQSGAERAGLRAGDRLLAVADQEVAMNDLQSTAILVRGPVPSLVHLVVERSDAEQIIDVPRQVVELPSVQSQLVAPGVGWIRVDEFTGRTAAEFGTALSELRTFGARSLLLDLRNNGGGLPSAAADVLSQLVTGSIAYREVRANGHETRVVVPFAATLPESMPLAVLVDGGTASAAEIVAAAIQDYERGPLIGTVTYGKGSVQGLFTLKDGSSVRITTARWLTPSGRPIEGVGLRPDLRGETDDEVLHLAVRHLAGQSGTVIGLPQLPPPEDTDGKVLV